MVGSAVCGMVRKYSNYFNNFFPGPAWPHATSSPTTRMIAKVDSRVMIAKVDSLRRAVRESHSQLDVHPLAQMLLSSSPGRAAYLITRSCHSNHVRRLSIEEPPVDPELWFSLLPRIQRYIEDNMQRYEFPASCFCSLMEMLCSWPCIHESDRKRRMSYLQRLYDFELFPDFEANFSSNLYSRCLDVLQERSTIDIDMVCWLYLRGGSSPKFDKLLGLYEPIHSVSVCPEIRNCARLLSVAHAYRSDLMFEYLFAVVSNLSQSATCLNFCLNSFSRMHRFSAPPRSELLADMRAKLACSKHVFPPRCPHSNSSGWPVEVALLVWEFSATIRVPPPQGSNCAIL